MKEKSSDLIKSIFDVYELNKSKSEEWRVNKKLRDKAAIYAKRQFKKEYPGKEWNQLTQLEKDTFIYVTIRLTFIEKYVSVRKKTRINKRIDDFLRDSLAAREELQRYNERMGLLYVDFSENATTEEEKKAAYAKFVDALKKYLGPNYETQVAEDPIPTCEEWVKRPIRIYDYTESSFDAWHMRQQDEARSDDPTYYPTQCERDHYALQALMKLVSEGLRKTIDVSAIEDCLSVTKNFYAPENEPLQVEYDPNLAIPEDEQRAIIQKNMEYFEKKRKLEELDFIIEANP